MNKTVKNIITVLLSLLIAGGLMFLALRGLKGNLTSIIDVFKQANYFWIVVAIIFSLLGYWARAVRWNLLLEPMGYKIKNSNAFWSISFGYFMNLGIPRSGEFARATALQTVEGVPFSNSFGTVVTERIVDLFFMLLFLGVTLFTHHSALFSFFDIIAKNPKNPTQPIDYSFWIYLLAGGLVVLFLVFFLFRKKIAQLSISQKIINLGKGFGNGLISVLKMKQRIKFIVLSFLLWTSYFLAAYTVSFALTETSFLQPVDGFYILSIGTLGMLVPASGGIGAFHLAMKIGFGALFLSLGKTASEGETIGLHYAFLSHTMQLFVMFFMGLISIFALAKEKRKKLNQKS